MESQKKYPPTFSFEFFPPKTQEGMDKLRATCSSLSSVSIAPTFFRCSRATFSSRCLGST